MKDFVYIKDINPKLMRWLMETDDNGLAWLFFLEIHS